MEDQLSNDGTVARQAEAPVDPLFLERWSPRSFQPDPVPREALRTLFEAARWAPSSSNEQPWLFLFATSPADRQVYASLLVEANRRWAERAPVLAFVLARRSFRASGKANRWAAFDSGAAWMALALQARRLGLDTHAMGGFDEEGVYQVLGVPKNEYGAMAAIAIGRRGDPAALPEGLADREQPSGRKPLAEVAIEGRFPARTGG